MTIKEAIKILSGDMSDLTFLELPDFLDALQLGIEALKFTLAVRGTILSYATLPLPGETE